MKNISNEFNKIKVDIVGCNHVETSPHMETLWNKYFPKKISFVNFSLKLQRILSWFILNERELRTLRSLKN